jgi:hypothetical protein
MDQFISRLKYRISGVVLEYCYILWFLTVMDDPNCGCIKVFWCGEQIGKIPKDQNSLVMPVFLWKECFRISGLCKCKITVSRKCVEHVRCGKIKLRRSHKKT